jgi:5-methylcytosine-specific restriction endonuclease McrA
MVWEILLLLNAKKIVLDGEEMNITNRLKTFLKGVTCTTCGIKGMYFMKTLYGDQPRPHLNLYGIDNHGNEVLMTSDHIIPRSRGGGNGLGNRQTMCNKCNIKKGNKLPEET